MSEVKQGCRNLGHATLHDMILFYRLDMIQERVESFLPSYPSNLQQVDYGSWDAKHNRNNSGWPLALLKVN